MEDFDQLPGASPDSLVVSPKQAERLSDILSSATTQSCKTRPLTLEDLDKLIETMRAEAEKPQHSYEVISPEEYERRKHDPLYKDHTFNFDALDQIIAVVKDPAGKPMLRCGWSDCPYCLCKEEQHDRS